MRLLMSRKCLLFQSKGFGIHPRLSHLFGTSLPVCNSPKQMSPLLPMQTVNQDYSRHYVLYKKQINEGSLGTPLGSGAARQITKNSSNTDSPKYNVKRELLKLLGGLGILVVGFLFCEALLNSPPLPTTLQKTTLQKKQSFKPEDIKSMYGIGPQKIHVPGFPPNLSPEDSQFLNSIKDLIEDAGLTLGQPTFTLGQPISSTTNKDADSNKSNEEKQHWTEGFPPNRSRTEVVNDIKELLKSHGLNRSPGISSTTNKDADSNKSNEEKQHGTEGFPPNRSPEVVNDFKEWTKGRAPTTTSDTPDITTPTSSDSPTSTSTNPTSLDHGPGVYYRYTTNKDADSNKSNEEKQHGTEGFPPNLSPEAVNAIKDMIKNAGLTLGRPTFSTTNKDADSNKSNEEKQHGTEGFPPNLSPEVVNAIKDLSKKAGIVRRVVTSSTTNKDADSNKSNEEKQHGTEGFPPIRSQTEVVNHVKEFLGSVKSRGLDHGPGVYYRYTTNKDADSNKSNEEKQHGTEGFPPNLSPEAVNALKDFNKKVDIVQRLVNADSNKSNEEKQHGTKGFPPKFSPEVVNAIIDLLKEADAIGALLYPDTHGKTNVRPVKR